MNEPGHNYFFPMPQMPWKESNMPTSILDRLDAIEERLNEIESTLFVLLEQQEEEADAIHDETA